MTAATFTTAPKVELEFRCGGDGCSEQWRCWFYLSTDTEASAMTRARANGWLRCAKCSREPATRVA